MNKKGFTLIELLAAIVIIGLISSIAIGGTSMYLDRTRQQAYDAMQETLYSAAQNYIIDRGVLVSETSGLTLDSATLISNGYIKELEDPKAATSNTQCSGTVNVQREKNTGSKLDKYTYTVTLQCSTYTNTKTYNS